MYSISSYWTSPNFRSRLFNLPRLSNCYRCATRCYPAIRLRDFFGEDTTRGYVFPTLNAEGPQVVHTKELILDNLVPSVAVSGKPSIILNYHQNVNLYPISGNDQLARLNTKPLKPLEPTSGKGKSSHTPHRHLPNPAVAKLQISRSSTYGSRVRNVREPKRLILNCRVPTLGGIVHDA